MEGLIVTNLADHLVVVHRTPRDVDAVVVPIGPRHVRVHIGIHARHLATGLIMNRFEVHVQSDLDSALRRGRKIPATRGRRSRGEGRDGMRVRGR